MSTPRTKNTSAKTVPHVRFAPGGLRALVAAHLAASPGEEFTVTQVARALNDSSGGAVGNALMALAASGAAVLTCAAPRRFRANDATAAAATDAPLVPVKAATTPKPKRPAKTKTTPKAPRNRKAASKPAAPSVSTQPSPPAEPSAPVVASSAVATLADPTASVTRPNGMLYRPRALAGLSDVGALRAAREAETPVLLYGPPGTGKTSLIEAAFPDVVTIAADGDCAVSDFVGEWTQNPDGTYSFIYGPLVTAMTEGRVLFVDDATLAAPKVLSCLYPAMDGRKTITVKAHKGETITAAPGFFVVAAHNPNVSGAVLTEALSSRFALHVHVASDYQIAEELEINPKAVRVAKNLATQAAAGEVTWSVQLRELLAFAKVEKVLGTEAAFANLIGVAPESDRDTVAEVVATVTGTEAQRLSVGARMTSATEPTQP
ncbi:nitric oxide reductase NorQ protein [Catenulispora sp. GAS73]|uniref:AAA family ATPase n=1 Tax=Catenulispora sp. GAS73 TaxID=3156269 RepID=UPI003516976F